MPGRLEDSNKRSREEAGLSSDDASAGQGADVLMQLAGSRKRHRGLSQTEQGQTSGRIPIASLLNLPEASTGSEQSGSDQSPVPVERSLERASRTPRQPPLEDLLRSPEQFGIPHRDPVSARRGADITNPTTDNPLGESTVGIQDREFRNKQKGSEIEIGVTNDTKHSVILTQYFKTEKGIDISVKSIRGGLRRPDTIVQYAKDSGKLSGPVSVSYWVRQARAWEEARENRNTPDQSVINDPSRYPDQSIPSSAGITNPTTDNPPEKSTVGIQHSKLENERRRKRKEIGVANHTRHSLVLTQYLQEVKGIAIDVRSKNKEGNKRPDTIVQYAKDSGKLSSPASMRNISHWVQKARAWEEASKNGGDPYETTDTED